MSITTFAFIPARPVLLPNTPFRLLDLRRGVSDLEQASALLSSAVNYLVSEQLAGRCSHVPANREAIAILCAAGRELARSERRRPAQRSIAAWLRGAALHRATSLHEESHSG